LPGTHHKGLVLFVVETLLGNDLDLGHALSGRVVRGPYLYGCMKQRANGWRRERAHMIENKTVRDGAEALYRAAGRVAAHLVPIDRHCDAFALERLILI
jgi:hypothetical protein